MKLIASIVLLFTTVSFATSWGEQFSDGGIRHSFLLTGNRTVIVEEDCRISWEMPGKSRDGEVLKDGNILIAFGNEVKEFTREKQVVFNYRLSKGNKEIGTASRLSNGNTLITELGAKPRLLEISKNGEIVVECPLKPETDNAHMQTRMARKLPNGNYLVPHLLAFAVKEYTPSGEVVRTINTDLPEFGGREAENWPFTAVLLENGNVLVNLTHGNKTAVFDEEGKVVWSANNDDVDGRFADPCGGSVLSNGNIVVCAYGQTKEAMPDVFELNADKQVVWEFKAQGFHGAHEIHVLTTNGKPVDSKR